MSNSSAMRTRTLVFQQKIWIEMDSALCDLVCLNKVFAFAFEKKNPNYAFSGALNRAFIKII